VNEATARTLNTINRTFYRDHARTFSETRKAPWRGWSRVVPYLAGVEPDGSPPSILDIGCGNARLARFLANELAGPLVYRGIDASASLLSEARSARAPGVTRRFERRDLVEHPLGPAAASERYSCVAAFGILHHIPGKRRRGELLERLAERLRPRGVLALTFWDFGADPRFSGKELSVAEYNRRAPCPLDPGQLELGDALLAWGEPEGNAVRYCHWVDRAEEEELLAGLRLEPIAAYTSDGRGDTLNRYHLLQRPG
jgi:SAM-dependent methyltransferase